MDVCIYRFGQLSGMVEPLAGLFGTMAVVVSPNIAHHHYVCNTQRVYTVAPIQCADGAYDRCVCVYHYVVV